MAIYWDEKYSVGVELIDRQHKKFVSLLDKLSVAISEGKEKEILDQILKELDDYTVYHFGTEEKYFNEFQFDGAAEHIKEHRRFVKKLDDLKKKFATEGTMMYLDLVTFMADWIVNHVEDMDKKYIKCFNEHGLR